MAWPRRKSARYSDVGATSAQSGVQLLVEIKCSVSLTRQRKGPGDLRLAFEGHDVMLAERGCQCGIGAAQMRQTSFPVADRYQRTAQVLSYMGGVRGFGGTRSLENVVGISVRIGGVSGSALMLTQYRNVVQYLAVAQVRGSIGVCGHVTQFFGAASARLKSPWAMAICMRVSSTSLTAPDCAPKRLAYSL